MTSEFPEASFPREMSTYFGRTCFSLPPKIFGPVAGKWHWNVIPASLHEAHPAESRQHCVQTHQDIPSSRGNKRFSWPPWYYDHQISLWKSFLWLSEQRSNSWQRRKGLSVRWFPFKPSTISAVSVFSPSLNWLPTSKHSTSDIILLFG